MAAVEALRVKAPRRELNPRLHGSEIYHVGWAENLMVRYAALRAGVRKDAPSRTEPGARIDGRPMMTTVFLQDSGKEETFRAELKRVVNVVNGTGSTRTTLSERVLVSAVRVIDGVDNMNITRIPRRAWLSNFYGTENV